MGDVWAKYLCEGLKPLTKQMDKWQLSTTSAISPRCTTKYSLGNQPVPLNLNWAFRIIYCFHVLLEIHKLCVNFASTNCDGYLPYISMFIWHGMSFHMITFLTKHCIRVQILWWVSFWEQTCQIQRNRNETHNIEDICEETILDSSMRLFFGKSSLFTHSPHLPRKWAKHLWAFSSRT